MPILQKRLFIEGQSVQPVDVTRHFATLAEMTSLEVRPGSVPWITLVLRKRAD